MPEQNETVLRRGTGLLIIEVVNSNPNGDPDRESDPRLRLDDRGEISPVSFKRKLRDLVEDKQGPVWQEVSQQFIPALSAEDFYILESRGREREVIIKEIAENKFTAKYWDGRVFGNTFLEKEAAGALRTGVVQFGLGVSIAPVRVQRLTTTNKAGVQKDKDRGMAPMAYRVVEHGIYCMPFFVNPTAARKSGCQQRDIDLLLKLIPHAYSHTASYIRSAVEVRHAWYLEHKSALGSASDFALLAALKPVRRGSAEEPSSSWSDYDVPQDLPKELRDRLASSRDLVQEQYAVTGA